MPHNSMKEVLRVGTSHACCINIKFSLVGLFILHIRLLMVVIPLIVVILDKVAVSVLVIHILVFLAKIAIMGKLDLLDIVKYVGNAIKIETLVVIQ